MPRDAPVLNVLQPLGVDRFPLLGKDIDLAARDDVKRDLRDRLPGMQRSLRSGLAHRHVPLLRQHRLDHFAGALAARYRHLVRLLGNHQAGGAQIGEHRLARGVALHAAKRFRRVVVDRRRQGEDRNRFKPMALTEGEIVEVVRRRDLHSAGAELPIDIVVGDHRDRAIRQR